MKLPHTSHPIQRGPSGFHTTTGVIPSQIQPQAAVTLPPAGVPVWQRGQAGKGAGECECALDKKTGYWIPTKNNNCRHTGVPQCTSTGGCNCVKKNNQETYGAARDVTAVRGLIADLGQ